jgi:hypothetical protein
LDRHQPHDSFEIFLVLPEIRDGVEEAFGVGVHVTLEERFRIGVFDKRGRPYMIATRSQISATIPRSCVIMIIDVLYFRLSSFMSSST